MKVKGWLVDRRGSALAEAVAAVLLLTILAASVLPLSGVLVRGGADNRYLAEGRLILESAAHEITAKAYDANAPSTQYLPLTTGSNEYTLAVETVENYDPLLIPPFDISYGSSGLQKITLRLSQNGQGDLVLIFYKVEQ